MMQGLLCTCAAPISVVIWHPQTLWDVLLYEGERLPDALLIVIVQLTAQHTPFIPLRPGQEKRSVCTEPYDSQLL